MFHKLGLFNLFDLVAKYMHHLACLERMKQKRERDGREKAERERNLSDEDVEWE